MPRNKRRQQSRRNREKISNTGEILCTIKIHEKRGKKKGYGIAKSVNFGRQGRFELSTLPQRMRFDSKTEFYATIKRIPGQANLVTKLRLA